MVKLKFEALGQGFATSLKSIDSGITNLGKSAVAAGAYAAANLASSRHSRVLLDLPNVTWEVNSDLHRGNGAGGVVGDTVGGTVGNVVSTGLTGVFSLGKGFRDFILRGTVVELAVAVVLGTAFTNLITAITEDFITPLIGAIFRGSNFWELSFEVNGSTFKYGNFINQLIIFILVCLVLYFGVVLPLNKLQYAAFKHKAIMRDCPRCLEEISMAATRCKWCAADIELDESLLQVLKAAEEAVEAEQQKQSWLMRFLTCCVRPEKAVLHETEHGALALAKIPDDGKPPGPPVRLVSRSSMRPRSTSPPATRAGSAGASRSDTFKSPVTSFSSSQAVCIDMQQLEAASEAASEAPKNR